MNNKTYITINGDKTPWVFEEKLEDCFCIVKNVNNGERFDGVIETISSRGEYKIQITGKSQ